MTWPTSVPILVFLGLSVLDLGPKKNNNLNLNTSKSKDMLFRARGVRGKSAHLLLTWTLRELLLILCSVSSLMTD